MVLVLNSVVHGQGEGGQIFAIFEDVFYVLPLVKIHTRTAKNRLWRRISLQNDFILTQAGVHFSG